MENDASFASGDIIRLKVEDLAGGGRGLAHASDGRVVFVAGALSGEEVSARLLRVKKDYMEAEVTEVHQASLQRVEPPCPVYGRCGGCQMQHLDYEAQVVAKATWVERALSRLGPLPKVEALASPRAWSYRHRVRLAVSRGRLGFYGAASNRLVPVENCPVAAKAVNRVLPGLAQGLGQIKSDHIAWLEVLAEEDRAFVTMGLDSGRPLSNRWRAVLRRLARTAGAEATRLSWGDRLEPWEHGPETGVAYYKEDGLELMAFPGLFVQANFEANRRLISLVMEQAAQMPAGEALDLYAGSGNFGLPLARAGRRVVAVEASPAADQAAAWQVERAGLESRVELVQAEAARATVELAGQGRSFELAVLDPPRAGAREVMPALVSLGPKRVIYISCHPAALARDAAVLVEAGYSISQAWAVDMFPQTGHTEAVLVLDRA